jgi:hypothetical protein
MKRWWSSFLFLVVSGLMVGSVSGFSPDRPLVLPPDLVGKVLQVDPKWDFVVLNVGADQGALTRAEMLVNRGGRLVAKVKIRRVEKNCCIADVMPGWKLAEVVEGDQVIPAYLPNNFDLSF